MTGSKQWWTDFNLTLDGQRLRPSRRGPILRMSFTLEWALAAQWWGYKLSEFEELPVEEQEYLIAVYRAHQMIQSLSHGTT